MKKSHIRKMFPGAVTANGFYSFYNYIIKPNAQHIYVIKGGPGVGKSTFMKKIGQEMVMRGYDVEYHCCSSDNNSIDGIVIPEFNIALLDGTAPHIVDPKNPGAVDEIINFGDFWNEDLILNSKDNILNCNYKINRYFKAAYICLEEAQIALKEWIFYVSEYQNWKAINDLYLEIENTIFKKRIDNLGEERHLFAWGHTPQGKVNHIDSLLDKVKTVYSLEGQPGTGKSTFLKNIARKASMLGYYVEYFHNTLNPEKLDMIIIPELEIGFVITSEPYAHNLNISSQIIRLDFNLFVMNSGLSSNQERINDCRKRFNDHITRAISNSSMAKAQHDLLETFYIPAMNFSGIENKREEIIAKILKDNTQQAIAVVNKNNTLDKEV